MTKITIGIAEDHVFYREGMVGFLNSTEKFEVIFQVGDGDVLLENLLLHRPDILMLDLQMPNMDGLTALGLIRKKLPEQKVIVLSSFWKILQKDQIERLSIDAVLSKNVSDDELCKMLTEVHGTKKIVGYRNENDLLICEPNIEKSILTNAEIKVLELLEDDKTNTEIAAHLKITKKTVEAHRYNILRKTKSKNLASVVKKLARFLSHWG